MPRFPQRTFRWTKYCQNFDGIPKIYAFFYNLRVSSSVHIKQGTSYRIYNQLWFLNYFLKWHYHSYIIGHLQLDNIFWHSNFFLSELLKNASRTVKPTFKIDEDTRLRAIRINTELLHEKVFISSTNSTGNTLYEGYFQYTNNTYYGYKTVRFFLLCDVLCFTVSFSNQIKSYLYTALKGECLIIVHNMMIHENIQD